MSDFRKEAAAYRYGSREARILIEAADSIEQLQSKLIAHGICPICDAEIICDYRAGKATNHRCKCGWKALEQKP